MLCPRVTFKTWWTTVLSTLVRVFQPSQIFEPFLDISLPITEEKVDNLIVLVDLCPDLRHAHTQNGYNQRIARSLNEVRHRSRDTALSRVLVSMLQPLRPNSIWSNRKKSEPSKATSGGATAAAVPAGQTATDGFAATAATTSDKPTKYMSKKAKKAARKEAKVRGHPLGDQGSV